MTHTPLEKELLEALKKISRLWPEPPNCADINPEWVGEHDGKARAILLEAAINIARNAVVHATAPDQDEPIPDPLTMNPLTPSLAR